MQYANTAYLGMAEVVSGQFVCILRTYMYDLSQQLNTAAKSQPKKCRYVNLARTGISTMHAGGVQET